jgi:hypothetical protein
MFSFFFTGARKAGQLVCGGLFSKDIYSGKQAQIVSYSYLQKSLHSD